MDPRFYAGGKHSNVTCWLCSVTVRVARLMLKSEELGGYQGYALKRCSPPITRWAGEQPDGTLSRSSSAGDGEGGREPNRDFPQRTAMTYRLRSLWSFSSE